MSLELDKRVSLAQIAAVFLGVLFIDTGYQAWLAVPAAHPVMAVVSLASYLAGFGALALSMRPRTYADEVVAAGFVLAFVVQAAIHVTSQPVADQYGTDALAFNHYSAQVLVQGRNPYVTSMEPAYREFNVPAPVYTPTTIGGLVVSQSYPALSFLIYVPFVLMHLRSMFFVELGVAVVAMLSLLFLAGRGRRAIAMLVFFIGAEYLNFAAGSVTDVVWLPFMIVVAAFWDTDSPIVPIALGLACAIKQDPWFVVPFALVHWLRRRKFATRNIAVGAAAFVLPNLPFILWQPSAWMRGVLFPMISGAVPAGSGIVQLITSNVLPFPIAWLSWLWPAVLVLGTVVYAARYRYVRWMPFVWPAIALFCSPRSLQNYFLYWPIVMMAYLLGALPAVSEVPSARASRVRRGVAFGALAATVGVVAVVATTMFFRPLSDLRIVSVALDPLTGYARSVRLHVGSRAAAVISQYAVDSAENGTVFWRTQRMRQRRGALDVDLVAPSLSDEVPISTTTGFQVAQYDPLGKVIGYSSYWTPQQSAVPALSRLHMLCATSRFAFLPEAAPLSWKYPPDDVLSGELRCTARGTHDGILAFALPKRGGDAWNSVAVSQMAYPGDGTLSFWVKPGEDSSASTLPTHIFGVSIVDDLNQQFYVMTNSRLRAPRTLTRDRFTYYVVPARLHAWNHVSIRIADLPGLYAAPYEPIQVLVMDAIHSTDAQRATDDLFGGFGNCPNRCSEGVALAAR